MGVARYRDVMFSIWSSPCGRYQNHTSMRKTLTVLPYMVFEAASFGLVPGVLFLWFFTERSPRFGRRVESQEQRNAAP